MDIHHYRDISQYKLNKELDQACMEGDMDAVKFLLTSSQIKNHADVHYCKEGFVYASEHGYFDIVRYLTSSVELEEHLDINETPTAFTHACMYEKMDIVRYFIFDLNIKKGRAINIYLTNFSNPDVEHFFQMRELSFCDNNKKIEKSNKI